jgi:hypothetical protein
MNQSSTAPSAGREATLIAALALPAMLLRAAQILEQDAGPALSDLRGFAADATTGALAALIVCLLASVRRWLGITFGIAWVLAAHANYEHVLALGSMTNLEHAGYLADSTFFFGSALSPTRPGLLAAALGVGVVLLLVAAPRHASSGTQTSASRRTPSPRPARIAAMGLVGCALLSLWPLNETRPGWRQRHFAIANALALFDTPLTRDAPLVAERIPGDLSGEPRIALPRPGQNVLLVILEGISGAHVSRIREAQDGQSPVMMPELDAIAERGLVWSSFVNLQRQTNRGEYALLCGDGPKLVAGTPKMTELAGMGELACLPARLREQGYATVYLQAAPLPFMLKDQFMAQAGFTAVHGDDWFESSYGRNHWGNDDRAFFEGSAEMVRKLQAKQEPWMLTLMTVGTHHPFNVPEDFEGTHPSGSFEWAAEYLDRAFGAFVRELEAEGLLDDTLVLVTSDESSGLHRTADDVTKALGQAWGLLIALTPEGENGLVEETALQSDLALSVLDYLGLGDLGLGDLGPGDRGLGEDAAAPAFGGRSAFRRYDTPRAFAFGNTYRRVLGGVNEHGELFVCNESASSCKKYALPDGRLFSPARESVELRPEELDFVKQRAIASAQSPAILPAKRDYTLIAKSDVQLVSTPNMQLIFSGQGLSARQGDRLEVELDFELRAGEDASAEPSRIWLAHDLIDGEDKRRHYLRRVPGLGVGQRAKIRYHVVAPDDLEGIEVRLRVHRFEGPAPVLHFHAARLRILPGAGAEAKAGTVEDEFRVVEAS